MAPTAVAVPQLELGPGWLFHAPIGSSLPTMTVAAGVFSDTWPVAWLPIGMTAQGTQFSYSLSVASVDAAEAYFPIARVPDGAEGSFQFEALDITSAKLSLALNGGVVVTTGSGATAMSKVSPPAPGAEVRRMIGWEAADSKHRVIGYQTLNSKDIAEVHRKGADKNAYNLQFDLEQSSLGSFDQWFAGTRSV